MHRKDSGPVVRSHKNSDIILGFVFVTQMLTKLIYKCRLWFGNIHAQFHIYIALYK